MKTLITFFVLFFSTVCYSQTTLVFNTVGIKYNYESDYTFVRVKSQIKFENNYVYIKTGNTPTVVLKGVSTPKQYYKNGTKYIVFDTLDISGEIGELIISYDGEYIVLLKTTISTIGFHNTNN